MKKILTIGLIVVSALSISLIAKKQNTSTKINETETIDFEAMRATEEFQNALALALEEKYGSNYEEIISLNNYAVESANKIENMLKISSTMDEEEYPKYYGGMYINDDQKLVLQIVKDEVPSTQNALYSSYYSTTNAADNEIIEYVDYSFNDLLHIYNSLNDLISSLHYDNVVGFYVDVIKNRVVVNLENNTDAKQKEFRVNVLDSNLIVFNSSNKAILTSSLSPGSKVGGCSVGFRAKYNNKAGYVTAGHCVMDGTTTFNGNPILKRDFKDGGTVDAMFVQTSDSISNVVPNWPYYPRITLGAATLPFVGQKVGKYGAVTGATIGTVTSAYSSDSAPDPHTGDEVFLTDLIQTDLVNETGDSGSALFELKQSPNLLGTMSLTHNDKSYAIKIRNITTSLGITLY